MPSVPCGIRRTGPESLICTMNAHLAAISSRLDSRARPVEPGRLDAVMWAALAALAVALGLSIWGGYHVGFGTLNALGADLPDPLLQNLTYLGDSLFALTLMLVFARRYPQMLWTAVIAALIGLAVSSGLKEVVDAMRPASVLAAGSFHAEGPLYKRQSFPSGHSVTAFVSAASFWCYLRGGLARVAAVLMGAAVAASRTLVGVHWPVDVLTGAAIGCGAVFVGAQLAKRWHWGLSLSGHLVLVICLAGCAITMLIQPLPYPKAEPFARMIAVIALFVALWNYGLAPQRQLRGAPLRTPTLKPPDSVHDAD